MARPAVLDAPSSRISSSASCSANRRVGRRRVVVGARGRAPVAEQQVHVHEPAMDLVLARLDVVDHALAETTPATGPACTTGISGWRSRSRRCPIRRPAPACRRARSRHRRWRARRACARSRTSVFASDCTPVEVSACTNATRRASGFFFSASSSFCGSIGSPHSSSTTIGVPPRARRSRSCGRRTRRCGRR